MRLFVVLALLAVGGCCASGGAPRPSSRVERVLEEVRGEFPDVREHFASMSYEESFAAGGELSVRGMPRLDDVSLLTFAAQRRVLLGLSDATCAQLFSGDDADAMAAMDALSDEALGALARSTALAQSLELRGGPRPLTRDAARSIYVAGLERLERSLSTDDAARFEAAMRSDDPAEACFYERTLLDHVLALPPDEGARLLRALLESAVAP